MVVMGENKKISSVLTRCLPQFNDDVREYLTKNLKTLGEDNFTDKISVHMAFYSKDQQGIRSELSPFAVKYCNGKAKMVTVKSVKDLSEDRWWKSQDSSVAATKECKRILLQREVNNSQNDCEPGRVCMVVALELNEGEYRREIYLLEVIKDILQESITDIKDIVEGTWKARLSGSGKMSLMDRYVKKVFKKWEEYPCLSQEDCCALSYEKNEGRECLARIYIGKGDNQLATGTEEKVVYFANKWNHAIAGSEMTQTELASGRIRYIRKMMESCKKNKYLFTSFDENNRIVELAGIADQYWLEQNQYDRYISFEGYGEWNLNEGSETLLIHTKGNFYFSRQLRTCAWKNELREKKVVEEDYLDKFTRIVEKLSEQEHGTCMIILEKDDAEAETKRLCGECSRGIQLAEEKFVLEGDRLEFLMGFTSLDGALLVDKQGKCYAFGVILDGKAVCSGNPAKGARHNSALTYINERTGRSAIIVSEDKTIQIKKSE